MLRVVAAAKLNLTLAVTGKRADGYHLLDSLVAFTDFGDGLTLEPAARLSLSVHGRFAPQAGNMQDNLVLRAAQALQARCHIVQGASITLEKNIPVGAGLGGGSSDAAAVLKALNRMWACGLTEEELREIGLTLGADVPACIMAQPLRMQGIGEILTAAALPDDLPRHCLLVKPEASLATKAVYAALEQGGPAVNQLQAAAVRLCPQVGQVLDMLSGQPGCVTARMSGSGSACFGLFASVAQMQEAAHCLREAQPQWWVQPSLLQDQRIG
jgi:4-diphosphocytidyl-2-C-methyl-D-erythritol kinase